MNKRLIIFLIIVISSIVLNGCDRELMLIQVVPEAEKEFAKKYVELLRQNDYEKMLQYMDDELKSEDLKANLKLLSEEFPKGDVEKTKLVGRQVFRNNYYELVSLKHEYKYENKWIITIIGLKKKDGKMVLTGIHAEAFNQSLQSRNAFKFDNAGLVHFFFLFVAVLVPLFILISLYVCYRTPIAKKKWLWLAFLSTGFGQFTLNWTTGHFAVTPFSIIVLGASAVSPGYMEPLKLSFAIPVGAMVFMIVRKRLLQKNDITIIGNDMFRDNDGHSS